MNINRQKHDRSKTTKQRLLNQCKPNNTCSPFRSTWVQPQFSVG